MEETMYETIEERNSMHEALCKELGDKLSAEAYISLCKKFCIEPLYMLPAYGWEP